MEPLYREHYISSELYMRLSYIAEKGVPVDIYKSYLSVFAGASEPYVLMNIYDPGNEEEPGFHIPNANLIRLI